MVLEQAALCQKLATARQLGVPPGVPGSGRLQHLMGNLQSTCEVLWALGDLDKDSAAVRGWAGELDLQACKGQTIECPREPGDGDRH